MTELKTLRGCGTALVTPFKHDGNIDTHALKKLVERQIDAGIDFLVPCGTTGESAALSLDEHLLVVETVIQTADGKVPVIAGAGSNNTKHAIELARECEKVGADGILVVTPYYNKPTQEGLYQHFKAISDHVNCPIILYNVPSRTSCNLLPATVKRLGEIDQIIGIKEAAADMGQVTELCATIDEEFSILSGDDVSALGLIAIGGSGLISVISNEMPKEMTQLVSSALTGDLERARELQYTLNPLMTANFIEVNPIPVKAALTMMGLIDENYRLPLVPMAPANREKLAAVLKQMHLI